jgi:hypothetical protein
MDSRSCGECWAIYRELQNAFRSARQRHSNLDTPTGLTDWLEQLNDYDAAGARATSRHWKTWRRWQQHRTLTGHSLPIVPPDAISNPN